MTNTSYGFYWNSNEKSAQWDANLARALVVVRFGHRPPAGCHKPTDRTDYSTLRRSYLARSVINSTRGAQHFSQHPADVALSSRWCFRFLLEVLLQVTVDRIIVSELMQQPINDTLLSTFVGKLRHNLSSVQSPQFVQKFIQMFVLLAEHHYLQTQSDVIITTSFQSLFESK